MSEKEIRKEIDQYLRDIEFEYNGVLGSICPFSQEDIAVQYGDSEMDFTSIDDMMNKPFIDGKPMKAICHKFII